MCERQPCIAESLFQGRGVRVQGCEEGGEGPPAPFWVAGPLSVGCESAISMGAPIAEALALVLTNLCLLISDMAPSKQLLQSIERGVGWRGGWKGAVRERVRGQGPKPSTSTAPLDRACTGGMGMRVRAHFGGCPVRTYLSGCPTGPG